ncbi:tail terminator [Mycobacterium phage DrLupo]|uniref:Tail terminator n=1 Tax=Mycobacterium phage DrLupo TaxID=2499037 RepID=A0A3S9UQK0_9CAUD|nr:tail terminator [Mycobacterium phage DrLupo]AZS12565.1 tail terminator [Mycobacterium phage DrLupo]
MHPAVLYDKIVHDPEMNSLGITPSRFKELDSIDKRPFDSGYFIVTRWLDQDLHPTINRGPRDLMVWVHTPKDRSRNFLILERILERINDIWASVEAESGTDGVRVTSVKRRGQSGNLEDEGWKTIARNATFSVLYDRNTV